MEEAERELNGGKQPPGAKGAEERRERRPESPSLPWKALAPAVRGVAEPIYHQVGADCPELPAWESLTEAWGRVVDYYLPAFAETPWCAALAATVIVAWPLIQAYPAWRARQQAASAERSPEMPDIR